MPTVKTDYETVVAESSNTFGRNTAGSLQSGRIADELLTYDPATKTFTFVASRTRTTYTFGPGDLNVAGEFVSEARRTVDGGNQALRVDWGGSADGKYRRTYSALLSLVASTPDSMTGNTDYRLFSGVLGVQTLDTAVPKTGSASYELRLNGFRTSPIFAAPLTVDGNGAVVVDFARGDITVTGDINSFPLDRSSIDSREATGTFEGTGRILSASSTFLGSFTSTVGPSAGQYSGNLQGQFYGPSGEEVGGSLLGTSTNGASINLSFAGPKASDTNANNTLASLQTTAQNLRTVITTVNLVGPSSTPAFKGLPLTEFTDAFGYSAGVAQYQSLSFPPASFSLSQANRRAAQDQGDYQAYASRSTFDKKSIEQDILKFDGSTDGITFSYASFVRVLSTGTESAQTTDKTLSYIGYGVITPPHQMPRSGAASYSGRIFGDLYSDSAILSKVNGTSSLSVDFASNQLNGSLTINRVDTAGVATLLDTYAFGGTVDRTNSGFSATFSATPGEIKGRFYGDAAQEYIAPFNINTAASGKIVGVSIGQKIGP